MQNHNNPSDLQAKRTGEAKSAWLETIKLLAKLTNK
jgi:hypothetical protein